MKLLWHATPDRNRSSIAERGLLVEFATGRLRAVWLHTFGNRQRVVQFIADRYQLERFQVSLVGVRVRRSWLRRFASGIWYCTADLEPADLILPFDDEANRRLYAESPF